VVGLLGSGPKSKELDGSGPKCVIKKPLGPQFKSGAISTSKVWAAKGFGERSKPSGWSIPKAKVGFKRKGKVGFDAGQVFLSPTQKVRILPAFCLLEFSQSVGEIGCRSGQRPRCDVVFWWCIRRDAKAGAIGRYY
jgi:hypothetical protein